MLEVSRSQLRRAGREEEEAPRGWWVAARALVERKYSASNIFLARPRGVMKMSLYEPLGVIN